MGASSLQFIIAAVWTVAAEIEYREEKDTMGVVKVPKSAFYAAQTQRSVNNFEIGTDIMPLELIKAFGIQKKACAMANKRKLGKTTADAIVWAAEQVMANSIIHIDRSSGEDKMVDGPSSGGRIISEPLYPKQFPLVIFQTGSGTQTNMNVNEVIANLANKYLSKKGLQATKKKPVHPNDDVNASQSTNDSFPTAMHIAVVLSIHKLLLPALALLKDELDKKASEFKDPVKYVKIGRTHMQDATPLTLGQEFSGWAQQVRFSIDRIQDGLKRLYYIAQGGTAVGTGINTQSGFDVEVANNVAAITGLPFKTAPNKFEALASHDALVEFAGIQNTVATSLMKIANDIRLLSSGPTGGLGEIVLPANEPGSSIMPGKVNPTQSEALSMLAAQVMGNSLAVSVANTQGHLDLNAFKPVMVFNVLKSNRLLADGARSFAKRCVNGIEANLPRMKEHLEKNLMLVTALNEVIGYEKSAEIAKTALKEGKTLKQVAVADKSYITMEQFDQYIRPEKMVNPRNEL